LALSLVDAGPLQARTVPTQQLPSVYDEALATQNDSNLWRAQPTNQQSMSAYRHASRLFPGTTVWVSDVDGFVWVATEPEALCETDELHVSWVRWTSRSGRHRVRLTYWVRTDVQMQSVGAYSDATHIRWTEPSTPPPPPPPQQRLPPPDAPNRPVGHSRRSVQTAHCARRLAFDQV
jgi:hypothetical protein